MMVAIFVPQLRKLFNPKFLGIVPVVISFGVLKNSIVASMLTHCSHAFQYRNAGLHISGVVGMIVGLRELCHVI
jgi:hypothetical protein